MATDIFRRRGEMIPKNFRKALEAAVLGATVGVILYGLFIFLRSSLTAQGGALLAKVLSANIVFLFNLLMYVFITCSVILVVIVYWVEGENIKLKLKKGKYSSHLIVKDYYRNYKRFSKTKNVMDAVFSQQAGVDRKLDVEGGFQDDRLSSGEKRLYSEKVLVTEIGFNKNGKLEGAFKTYDRKGRVEQEIHFKDGKLDGPYRTFYESGTLHTEKNYRAGKLNGTWKACDEDGTLFFEIEYKDNVQDGIDKSYFKNGVVQYEDIYRNGKKIKRKTFDEGGTLLFDHDFK
jgi:antitoxin component YwqK of YwqJK toxin-antitoxin module